MCVELCIFVRCVDLTFSVSASLVFAPRIHNGTAPCGTALKIAPKVITLRKIAPKVLPPPRRIIGWRKHVSTFFFGGGMRGLLRAYLIVELLAHAVQLRSSSSWTLVLEVDVNVGSPLINVA